MLNLMIAAIQFITVDPGHFHAALVQKTQYHQVSRDVYVYAPAGDDLESHLAKIDAYNQLAREVLIPRGVRINELGDFAAKECAALHRDWVHYSDEGSSKLADEIIEFLEKENLL